MASDLFNVGLGLDTPLPPLNEEHLPAASNIVHGISQDLKIHLRMLKPRTLCSGKTGSD